MKHSEIIVATKNKGKVKEFAELLKNFYDPVRSLLDFESVPEIIEDGLTFEENAVKKAEIISKFFNKTVLSDDSGLVVDALDGEPGVYSARYAGEGSTDEENIEKLLKNIKPFENRKARFVCVLVLIDPDNTKKVFDGSCEGVILDERIGENGFGYDPVFFVPEHGKTMAELDPEIKNSISHRSNAVGKLKSYLDSI